MRTLFLSLGAILLVAFSSGPVEAQTTVQNAVTVNLSLGARSTQVTLLQQLLNKDPLTRIAATGPGSPGYETDYFGALTRAAVVRFQNKYASEVLAPAGLSAGSGYVGVYTRIKLNALSTVAKTTPPQTKPISTSASTNPNLKNLDQFLSAIDTVGTSQGFSATSLATAKAQVVQDVATTTDLRSTFLNMVPTSPQQSALNDDSFSGQLLASIEHLFTPEHARAATGVPFGGAVVYAFICTCSLNWDITISPLPPSYVALLTYIPGSQAYLSYNIPATPWLLGEEAPSTGACYIYVGTGCFLLPSQGIITPVVGSAPI